MSEASVEKRVAPRVKVGWSGRIRLKTSDGQEHIRDCRVINVSKSGVGIYVDIHLPSTLRLDLTFTIPPGMAGASAQLIQTVAEVCYSSLNTQGYQTGLKFITIPKEQSEQLSRFVQSRLQMD